MKIKSYPDEEQIQFLLSKPYFRNIHTKLNHFFQEYDPKTYIVPTPEEHIDLEQLLNEGKFFSDHKTVFKQMRANRCHDNCDILLHLNIIHSVCTGFALSDDGLWRYHSWGLDHENKVVETTAKRLMYFGIVL